MLIILHLTILILQIIDSWLIDTRQLYVILQGLYESADRCSDFLFCLLFLCVKGSLFVLANAEITRAFQSKSHGEQLLRRLPFAMLLDKCRFPLQVKLLGALEQSTVFVILT